MRFFSMILRHGYFFCLILVHVTAPVYAQSANDEAYGASGSANVADNMKMMDTNHDGLVSADEVAAFIRKKSSLNVDDLALKKLDAEMQGQRCGSPFSGSVY